MDYHNEAASMFYGNLSDITNTVIWKLVPTNKVVSFPPNFRRFIEASIINHSN